MPGPTLVEEGRVAGARDAYEFAEWLVQVRDHFGDCRLMDVTELEMAYEEAMAWWDGEARPRR
jgi:hypothetical protein